MKMLPGYNNSCMHLSFQSAQVDLSNFEGKNQICNFNIPKQPPGCLSAVSRRQVPHEVLEQSKAKPNYR